MNRKLISVVFSALVCSTLGHEYLRANEISRHHERLARKAPHVGIHESRAAGETCSYYCPVPRPSSPDDNHGGIILNLVRGVNIFGLVNTSKNVSIVFHLEESLVVLINGETGVTILIDIVKEVGIYFPAGANDNLWLSSKLTFEEYIAKIGVLTVIKNWSNGQSFKLNATPKQVTTAVVSIIVHLSYEISQRVNKNPDGVISIIVVLTKTLVKSTEIVSLLLSKLGNVKNTLIQGGLVKLVGTIQGLLAFSQKLPGALNVLIGYINISLLLSQSSGLGSILYILSESSKSVDLSKVLGNQLQNPEDLISLAVVLDFGNYVGISGIVAVIHNVQLYAAKKISLEDLIDILIQVEASNVVKVKKETWKALISSYLSVIQEQTTKYNSGQYWSLHKKFAEDIDNERLVVSGINVSAIINTLISNSGSCSLNRILTVLLELKVVTSLTLIVATLYLRLIWFIVSGQGIIFVLKLIPNLNLNINFSSLTSIIQQILSTVNITSLLRYIVTLDVVGLLTHLPVLGPIFESLESALKAVGAATQVSLSQALKQTTSVLATLKNWIWFALGQIGGSKPSGGGIAGLSVIGGGITISWSSTWTSTSSWTSSSSNSGSGGSGSTVSGGGGSSGSGGGGGGSSGSGGVTIVSGSSGSGGGGSSGSGGVTSSGGLSVTGGGGSSGSGGGGSSGSGGGGSSGSGGVTIIGGGSGGGGSSAVTRWSWGWGGSSGSGGSSGGSGGSSGSGGGGGGSSGSGGVTIVSGSSGSGGGGSSGSGGVTSSGGLSVTGGGGSSGSGGGGSSGSGGGGSSGSGGVTIIGGGSGGGGSSAVTRWSWGWGGSSGSGGSSGGSGSWSLGSGGGGAGGGGGGGGVGGGGGSSGSSGSSGSNGGWSWSVGK